MAYVDEVYYNDSFSGEPVDTTDFPSLCRRAEEIIEEMTLYRVTPVTFPAMPEDMQTRIKDAVCAQIEYLDANGGADLDMGDGLAGHRSENSVTQVHLPDPVRLFSRLLHQERSGSFGQQD